MIVPSRMAFAQFSSRPFPFIWASVIYVVLQLMFLFGCLGIFLIYFFLASVLGLNTSISSIPSIIALSVSGLIFLIFTNGLNAGLMKAYYAALENRKTTVADFLHYSTSKSLMMFSIMLLRDIVYALLAALPVVLYIYVLSEIAYMNYLLYIYLAGLLFVVHFLFTPAFISAGTYGTSFFQSLRNGFYFIRRNHINALGLYILFAFIWILNFVPLLQLLSIFAVYPIVYSALILMFRMSHSG